MNLEMESAHTARRAAKAQLFPPDSKSQCTRGHGPKCVSVIPGFQSPSQPPKHNFMFYPIML